MKEKKEATPEDLLNGVKMEVNTTMGKYIKEATGKKEGKRSDKGDKEGKKEKDVPNEWKEEEGATKGTGKRARDEEGTEAESISFDLSKI